MMAIVNNSLASMADTSFTTFWLSSFWILFQTTRKSQIHSLVAVQSTTGVTKCYSAYFMQLHISTKEVTNSPNLPNLQSAALNISGKGHRTWQQRKNAINFCNREVCLQLEFLMWAPTAEWWHQYQEMHFWQIKKTIQSIWDYLTM